MSGGSIPPPIFRTVCGDNNQFLFDRQVIHRDFFGFAASSLASLEGVAATTDADAEQQPGEFGTLAQIQWATRFALDTLAHAAENSHLTAFATVLCRLYVPCIGPHSRVVVPPLASPRWCVNLLERRLMFTLCVLLRCTDRYSSHVEACKWFLQSAVDDPTLVQVPLLTCPTDIVRNAVADIVRTAWSTLLGEEAPILLTTECVVDGVGVAVVETGRVPLLASVASLWAWCCGA